jgi:hypothetical protein
MASLCKGRDNTGSLPTGGVAAALVGQVQTTSHNLMCINGWWGTQNFDSPRRVGLHNWLWELMGSSEAMFREWET